MEELKPCPFCMSTNVSLDTDDDTIYWVKCNECGSSGPENEVDLYAIDAWNRRAEPPNEPLTLEELLQMDGEPVWVEIPGQGKRWALVDVTWKAQKVVRFTYSAGASRNVEEEFIYGGKAYRRRPEEITDA